MEPSSAKKRKAPKEDLASFYPVDTKGLEPSKKRTKKDCPYLGQIKRHLLDFDKEKNCSITLSNLNVYCCLVCGKYFQGKGVDTKAYLHALSDYHNVFINL